MAKKGRPTEYNLKLVKKVEEYLDDRQDTIDDVKLPTMQGLAVYLGVNGDTLVEWAKEYPEFSAAIEKVKREQHDRLVNKSLKNQYNAVIAKLMLSSNHGYKEKQEQDLKHSGSISLSQLFDKAKGDENN